MELWEVLVPTKRNDGKPFRTRHHKEWDKQIRKITGGLTILSPAKGQWTSVDGELFHDRMIPVRIACSRHQVAEIVQRTLKHYDQLAVMVYKVSDEVYIVNKDRPILPVDVPTVIPYAAPNERVSLTGVGVCR